MLASRLCEDAEARKEKVENAMKGASGRNCDRVGVGFATVVLHVD